MKNKKVLIIDSLTEVSSIKVLLRSRQVPGEFGQNHLFVLHSELEIISLFQYLVFSIVLGIIGVGGLVFQWAQSIIDQWYKDIEDLQTRVKSLESRSTTVSVPQSVLDSITTLQTDLTALTTKHADTCARVSNAQGARNGKIVQ